MVGRKGVLTLEDFSRGTSERRSTRDRRRSDEKRNRPQGSSDTQDTEGPEYAITYGLVGRGTVRSGSHVTRNCLSRTGTVKGVIRKVTEGPRDREER